MRQGLCLVLSLGAAACSWSRFDDVTESAPIVMLERPGAMTAGFGASVVSATSGDQTLLFVGGGFGVSSASTYPLGSGESPSTKASDTGYCYTPANYSCSLGLPAGLDRAVLGGEPYDLCFAVGLGRTPIQGDGVVVRCNDGTVFGYPIPESYVEAARFTIDMERPELLALAGDGSTEPWLVATAPSQPIAWFYRFGSIDPVNLEIPGSKPRSFGKSVAALSAPDGRRLLVVGAPDEQKVFLFRADDQSVAFIGCLGGTSGFGRAMTSGIVINDGVPELVISDDRSVYVFDGAVLLDLPETDGNVCTLAALPEGGLFSSFGCASRDDVTGCNSSRFGAALGVGDLDGDGDGELAVGAPEMTARDVNRAGAVLIWDLEQPGDTQLTDVKFMSSAEERDELGAALALPRVGLRSILAAGAPGNGKVALFYCSSLLPPELRGARCQ